MNKEQFIKLAVQSGYGKEEAAREYTEANDKAEYGNTCKWEDYPTHDKGCKDCFLEWLKSEAECEK